VGTLAAVSRILAIVAALGSDDLESESFMAAMSSLPVTLGSPGRPDTVTR
jgi:hypothetical protein